MAFFYRFVAAAMDLENLESPTAGMMTPYSALFVFAIGIFASNFLFNTLVMKKPFTGEPVNYSQYFKGSFSTHLVGILGGIIWALGTACSYIAAGKAECGHILCLRTRSDNGRRIVGCIYLERI